jgi:hypothetical protein
MATALEIINRSMSIIGVKSSGVDLSTDEINDAIESMNDMMLALDVEGIRLGFNIVESSSDEITAPDWSYGMMKYNLALLLADEYNKNVTASLVAVANKYMMAVRNRVVNISQPIFSDTLPIGSGHNNGCGSSSSNFFQDTDSDDLLFGNGEHMLDDESEQLELED